MILIFRDVLDELGLSAALIYGVIYGHIKERMVDTCLLEVEGISVITGLHAATVRTHLYRLCMAGWLERRCLRKRYYGLTSRAPKVTARELAKFLDPIQEVV